MALTLTLYSFSKRKNSTAIPSGGTTFSITLKQETSLDNPVFYLNADDLSGYNYAAFNGAYYWIRDIRSVRDNLWEVECSIDVLATCRSAILATSAYVEYAQQGNSNIVDVRLAAQYSPTIRHNTQSFEMLDSWGQFYVSVVGEAGSTGTYACTYSGIYTLLDDVANWAQNTIDGTDAASALKTFAEQAVSNNSAANAVKASYWLPIKVGLGVESQGDYIYLGQFKTTSVGRRVLQSTQNVKETKGVIIPHNFMDWRRQEPYTEYYLYLPMYGTIQIPASIGARNDSLLVNLSINQFSGEYTYKIAGATDGLQEEIVVGGSCYSPVLIGSSNVAGLHNATGALAESLTGTVGSAIAGILGAAKTIGSFKSIPVSAGSQGGSSNLGSDMTCFTVAYPTSEAPAASAATHGIPMCRTASIGSLTGYVETRGFSLQGAYHSDIIDMVNDFMDSGVFIE